MIYYCFTHVILHKHIQNQDYDLPKFISTSNTALKTRSFKRTTESGHVVDGLVFFDENEWMCLFRKLALPFWEQHQVIQQTRFEVPGLCSWKLHQATESTMAQGGALIVEQGSIVDRLSAGDKKQTHNSYNIVQLGGTPCKLMKNIDVRNLGLGGFHAHLRFSSSNGSWWISGSLWQNKQTHITLKHIQALQHPWRKKTFKHL